MQKANVHNASLVGEKLEERLMAALFMLWQLTVVTMGEVLNINAFD